MPNGGRPKTDGKQQFPAGEFCPQPRGASGKGCTGRQSGVSVPLLAAADSPAPRRPRGPLLRFPCSRAWACSQAAALLWGGRTVGLSVTPGVSVRLLSVVHHGPRGRSLAQRRCQPRARPQVWERFPRGRCLHGASRWPVVQTHAVCKNAAPETGLGARRGTPATAFLWADWALSLPGQGLVHLPAHWVMPRAQETRRGVCHRQTGHIPAES